LDFTVYVDEAPISALNPILWLEADRMKTLDFSVANLDNQRNVVKEEERSRSLNQPYAHFYFIDLREKAFDTFANKHNASGDFKDLDAAKLADVKSFFDEYYAPNNAVLAVAGDVKSEEVFATVEKYFGGIPRRNTPLRPDVSELPQQAERKFTQEDRLARVPALAIGYRMPPRKSRDAIVGAVVGDILYGGKASRLYQSLVQNKKFAISVTGGMNWPFGPLEYNGPTLMTGFIIYSNDVKESDVLSAYDAVIQNLASNPVSASELEDVVTKARADWYGELETPIDRAVALSWATLFDGTPAMVNAVPGELASVTPAEIRAFVQKYLVKTNRTIINRVPAASVKQPSSANVKGGK
jgi:predicted Zn-dependent peptidase